MLSKFRSTRSLTRAVIACVSGACVSVSAMQDQPRFRTGVDLTRVEITVLDRHTRKPIRGLEARDFRIKLDGKVQKIVTLAEVSVEGVRRDHHVALLEAPNDVNSNDRMPSRLFTIVMDDASGGNDPFTRRTGIAIGHRVIDRLGSEDMAAVVFTRDNRHAQEFTSDRTLLRRAVERYNPMDTIGTDPIGVLRRAREFLGRMLGYRRALIFVAPIGTRGSSRGLISRLVSDMESSTDLSQVSVMGTISHVPIYVFSPDGLRAPTAEDMSKRNGRDVAGEIYAERARTIASLTGGRAVVGTNDPAELVPAVLDELSSYYLLAYENAPPTEGRRWLEVETTRTNTIILPSRVLVGRPRPAPRVRTARPQDLGLIEALAAPLPSGDLPLRLSTVAVGIQNKREHAVVLTLGLPPVESRTDEAFHVQLSLFDGEGRRELMSQTQTVKVSPLPASAKQASEVALRLDLRSARYQLRIAVQQASTNRVGSVHATLVVPDFGRETLAMSGVALSQPRGLIVGGRETIAGLLPFVPTAVRRFAPDEMVSAFVRVYQRPENRSNVALSSEVFDVTGAVVHKTARSIDSAQFHDGVVEHPFELPLSSLSEGDYLLRCLAITDSARVQRDLRFSVAKQPR